MNDIMNDTTQGALVTTADAGALAQLNSSEIQQQIATAHAFPRNVTTFRDEVQSLATLTADVAEECSYSLPRKDKDGNSVPIIGPSARFAEIVAMSWGNCHAAARVVDDKGTHVVAQGVFWDLQKNARITYEVSRSIVYRNGGRYTPDMIGVTGNAACSIALRNAILKGVPKAFWADLWEQSRKVAVGDAHTLAERRTVAFKKLALLNVSPDMILAKLGRPSAADITLDDLGVLLGIYQALKEGDSTVEDMFPPVAAAAQPTPTGHNVDSTPKVTKGTDKLRDALKKAAPAAPVATTEGFSYQHVNEQLQKAAKAKDAEAFALARDLVKDVADEAQRAELDVEARRLAKQFDADEAGTRG
jgi:hypothetical protein